MGPLDITLLVIALVQFFAISILLYKVVSNGNTRVFREMIQELESHKDRQRAENVSLKERILELESGINKGEVMSARSMLLLIEAAYRSMPFPQWIKNKDLVMVSLTDEYERIFLFTQGKTRIDYVNKKDSDVWPPQVAKEYGKNDADILRGKVDKFIGKEPIWLPGKDVTELWIIAKYAIYGEKKENGEKEIIGVGGIAIQYEDQESNRLALKFIDFMLRQGNLHKALDRLSKISEDSEDVIMLQSRLNTLARADDMDIIDKDDSNRERNKIAKAMLRIIERVENPDI